MSDLAIETRGLTRYFGSRCVVDHVDLQVPRGGVFAFVGRNGSGKTTTIRMLLGLLEPTRGTARVLGCDSRALPAELRGRVGYLAENHPLYGGMTVGQLGRFQAAFFPRWNPQVFQGVVDHFQLALSTKAKHLSRGQRAGLALALTLAPEPELLILDDPALGLDPVARRSLLESMIYVTRRADRTILFSSHLLTDVERVADHIAVLDRSVLRAQCPVETFRNAVRRYVLRFPGPPPATVGDMPGLLEVFRTERELRITLVHADETTRRRLEALHPDALEDVPLGLEDAFVSYLSEHGEKTSFLQPAGGVA